MKNNNEMVEEAYRGGIRMLDLNKIEESFALFEYSAVFNTTKDIKYVYKLAEVCVLKSKNNYLKKYFKEKCLDTSNPLILFNLYQIFHKLYKYDHALRVLDLHLTNFSEQHIYALQMMSSIYKEIGNYEEYDKCTIKIKEIKESHYE